ncbi:hypothetical protein ES703_124778 [subsurface metagenome]
MKRFVDLRLSKTGYNFAWYDTVIDKFEEFNGNQTWDTWNEFAADYKAEEGKNLNRYYNLCPPWILF